MRSIKIRDLYRNTWTHIVLVAGLGYVFFNIDVLIVQHIGTGLIVAATVAALWHIREFTEFFEKYAESILVHNQYLSKLDIKELSKLRTTAAGAILSKFVNNPNYDRISLEKEMDELLYTKSIVENKDLAGVYRKNLTDRVCLQFLTLEEALIQVDLEKAKIALIPGDMLKKQVMKVSSVMNYTVVSPRLGDKKYDKYTVSYSSKSSDMEHFPIEKRITIQVGNNQGSAKSVEVKITDDPHGGIQSKIKEPVNLEFLNGECPVWLKVEEYRWPENESHVLNTMSMLTKDLQVHLYKTGTDPKLVFDGGIIATGDFIDPIHNDQSVHLTYNGWLFENQGYYIWWWKN